MRRIDWTGYGIALIVVICAALTASWIVLGRARAQTVDAKAATTAPAPAPVAMSYWIAECNGWPLAKSDLADDGIRVDRVSSRPGRVTVRLSHPATRRRAHLVAHRLGSREAGWSVWSVRGPTAVGKLMKASDKCRVVATYTQARSWPKAARDWLLERSTCYGSATWRGRVYRVWPCVWSTERAGQGSITNLAAIGPGVIAGGSGAAAAGFTEE